MDDDTRAFAKRFAARPGMNGKMPSGNQAGVYASTLAYLNAVAATGSDDARDAVPQMKKFKGKDKLFGDVTIRQDGRVIHPMYLFEVKKPERVEISLRLLQSWFRPFRPIRRSARSPMAGARW